MKLLLLGAGASFGASRHGEFPAPLVTGILPAAVKLGLFDPMYAKVEQDAFIDHLRATGADPGAINNLTTINTGEKHLEVLAWFIEQQFGVRPAQYAASEIDFERLFALTEAELLGYHAFLRYKRQMPGRQSPSDVLDLQLKLVLCGTLIAATRDLRCDFHDVLAGWLKPQDMVVSFNYDTLMDRSLKATGRWHPDDGYGISFHRHGHRVEDRIVWREPKPTSSPIRLAKPHGSLNWLYPRNSWDSVMNISLQSAPMRQAPLELYCLDDIYPAFEEDYPSYEWWEKYDVDYSDFTFDLHSLLVPPSLSKPYRSFEPQMGPVWGMVIDAILVQTEEIYIVGYSLRQDDLRTAWLLRKASAEAERLKRVVIVSPSEEVLERARQLFDPIPVTRLCPTLMEFAEMISKGTA